MVTIGFLVLQANIFFMLTLLGIMLNALAKLVYCIEVQFSEKPDLYFVQPISFHNTNQNLEDAMLLQDADYLLLLRKSDIQENLDNVASLDVGVDAEVQFFREMEQLVP